jgi:biotin operon repressor
MKRGGNAMDAKEFEEQLMNVGQLAKHLLITEDDIIKAAETLRSAGYSIDEIINHTR